MLTDPEIKAAKPDVAPPGDELYKPKPYKLSDGKGLYLLVYPNGVKGWRFRYQRNGKETTLSFNNYPDVSLAEARDLRDDARKQIRRGIDPVAQRRAEKKARAETFKEVAEEFLDKGCPTGRKGTKPLSELTIFETRRKLERWIYPHHGTMPVSQIGAPDLLQTLTRVVSRGYAQEAHKIRSFLSRIFRYALVSGRAQRDPAGDLKGTLPAFDRQHFVSVTDTVEIGKLLRALDHYRGDMVIRAALRLAPYVFVRPKELRTAQWEHIDFDDRSWTIPSEIMKMKRPHWVPLCDQAVAILEELREQTGHSKYVFQSTYAKRLRNGKTPTVDRALRLKSNDYPISTPSLNVALKRLGYEGRHSPHSFRAMASTMLNQLGFNADWIEWQLAHVEKNAVRASYNRAEYRDDRRRMVQEYADFLDGLRADTSERVVNMAQARQRLREPQEKTA